MTHCDAEKAVHDDSYKSASDDELREMHRACLTAGGPNQSAVQRIRKIGDIVWQELTSREERRREQEDTVGFLAAVEVSDQSVAKRTPKSLSPVWDEAKLARLIQDGIEESPGLEYKAARALGRKPQTMTEIAKDVSSMANSAGGVLIYGISEFQDAAHKHLPERVDPIDRTQFSKEWLEHVISQIRPRLSDVLIQPVPLNSAEDHVAYVVEIPQGTTAHQAPDFRYYRRYNFESVPMLDHEVRDVMNRRTHPHVTVGARFVVYARPTRDGDDGALAVTITNSSDVLARYIGLVVNAPIRVRGKLISYSGATIEESSEGSSYRLSFSNHIGPPLFPRATLSPLFQFRFLERMEPEPKTQLADFRFSVFADSMPKKAGSFSLDEIMSK